MDLELIHSSNNESDLYASQLENALSDISPKLFFSDYWDKDFVQSLPQLVNNHIDAHAPINFEDIPSPLSLELKLYWAHLLADPRMNSRSIVERRFLPMEWFRAQWQAIFKLFNVTSLADIPHPEFPIGGHTTSHKIKREHNQQLLSAFSEITKNSSRSKQKIEYVRSGKIEKKEYLSGRITVVGDFHKKILIQREQFKAIHKRNIILLNDLYSESNVRFKDIQKQHDMYINLYPYPEWLRPVIKQHIISKIEYDELAPKTLPGYIRRMTYFRDFIYERFANPSPSIITDTLLEDEFISWGNKKGLAGKNWYTDCVAMLQTGSRKWPDIWPAISVSHRATKKIEKSHYKEGLGRIGYAQEGANRSYSQRVVDDIRVAVEDTPLPVPRVFALILGTGMRSEDGHAVLFDCLEQDPNDNEFMLLTFWQNKVRKWNVKPLHKREPAHAELINIIETQRSDIIRQYGKATKYLFPIFNGTHESFIEPKYTLGEIKLQCVKHNILTDKGTPLAFSWHPLRHTKGTSLAMAGHDVLSIMMELGHASPDMATVYINNRLELKKKALLESGGGRFYTIEGRVDERVSELMVRKEQISATRVCGGACTMPAQIGDWCEHANSCYICKHYRADAKDLEFFKIERGSLISLIEAQQEEALSLAELGRTRMSEITNRRLGKNKEIYSRLNAIVTAIESDGKYQGSEQQLKKVSLETE